MSIATKWLYSLQVKAEGDTEVSTTKVTIDDSTKSAAFFKELLAPLYPTKILTYVGIINREPVLSV